MKYLFYDFTSKTVLLTDSKPEKNYSKEAFDDLIESKFDCWMTMWNKLFQNINITESFLIANEKRALAVDNYIDSLPDHIRFYLLGTSKTLHRVMFELRQFKQRENYREQEVIEILEDIEEVLHSFMCCETMPRYLRAKKKILKELKRPINKEKS